MVFVPDLLGLAAVAKISLLITGVPNNLKNIGNRLSIPKAPLVGLYF